MLGITDAISNCILGISDVMSIMYARHTCIQNACKWELWQYRTLFTDTCKRIYFKQSYNQHYKIIDMMNDLNIVHLHKVH